MDARLLEYLDRLHRLLDGEMRSLPASAQRVLLQLVRESRGRNQDLAAIGYARLAARTGFTRMTIQRAIRLLRRQGWIEAVRLPECTGLLTAGPASPSPRSGSASSMSRWTAQTARPWPPTANRPSRSPWGPLPAPRHAVASRQAGKGAFENGNIGTLTRRVPADRVVHAVPPRVLNRKPPKAPKTPRVVELLRKAIEWQALIESGEAANQAEIASREGITRARVTQVMGLLRLAPEIQEHILSLPDMVRRPTIIERALRPITQMESAADQRARFQDLIMQN